MLGILLADKPLGITSHDAINLIRRRFGTRRVGHAGTLDPLATGLLVIAIGPATRFLQYLPLEPKEYVAEITFGVCTDTFDREGNVTQSMDVPNDLWTLVELSRQRFLGLIQQLPPMHSAVKIRGKALYRYARAGEEVEREPRTVHIDRFDIEPIGASSARAKVVCSGGTYIRSLAHDLGQAVGCGAHLSGLVRTGVGRFRLEDAVPLDMAEPGNLIPLKEALPPMPLIELSPTQVLHIREGRAIVVSDEPCGPYAALADTDGTVFSVARVTGNLLHPECVIPAEVFNGPF